MRRIRRGARSATALALASLVLSASHSAAPVFAATVAVFDDGAYVDTSSGGLAAESDNLQATLTSLGHQVLRLTSIAALEAAAAAKATDIIAIPELENGDLAGALNSVARATLAAFVADGRGLIVIGTSDDRAVAFANAVFGLSVTSGVVGPATITSAVIDTSYAGGPISLAENDRTRGLDLGSLPSTALAVYLSGSRVPVARFSHGSGRFVYLGWDWYAAAPTGGQDGGWLAVLASTIADLGECSDGSGPDGDADGVPDVCDPTPTGCADVDGQRLLGAKSKLSIKHVASKPLADSLALSASLSLPAGSAFASLDPRVHPVNVVIRGADGSVRIAQQLPIAEFEGSGSVGWSVNARGTKWVFRDTTGTFSNGFARAGLRNHVARNGEQTLRIQVKGRRADYAAALADSPLGLLVVVGDSELGECGEKAYAPDDCTLITGASRLKCKTR